MSDPQRLLIDLVVLGFFLTGIARFRRPESARAGTWLVAAALLGGLAVAAAQPSWHMPAVVLAALALGALPGWLAARRVTMTGIPAMVGFQNGAGGLAAALVSWVELTRAPLAARGVPAVAGLLGLAIGAITFAGSMIAGGKLANLFRQTPIVLPWHGGVFRGLLLALVALAIWTLAAAGERGEPVITGLGLLALAAGVVLSLRVGGADMPVLISFLNALSGLAAAFCGVAIANRLLIACGATVAASGLLLTHAMCRAMNRRWQSVLLGAGATLPPGASRAKSAPRGGTEAPARGPADQPSATPLAAAVAALRAAQRIILVPGYGLALASAQVPTVQLANRLSELGKDVKFAIHPIAGRMPGHMHVLLAEAEVDPAMLVDLEDINPEFSRADLVVVVGACDVVNPAAIDVPGTPISGMPILQAHTARQVLVCNLDLHPGYSGVDNPLYHAPTTLLLLGDAGENLRQLLAQLR